MNGGMFGRPPMPPAGIVPGPMTGQGMARARVPQQPDAASGSPPPQQSMMMPQFSREEISKMLGMMLQDR